jgi:hypothetical protein
MVAQAASDNTSYFTRAGLSRKQGLIKLSNLETQKNASKIAGIFHLEISLKCFKSVGDHCHRG